MTDRRVVEGLALYTLGITSWLLLAGVRVTKEGGLYYFEIAQNLAAGAGSTFDGVHVTNGYHPLWVLCLVPVFWMRSEPESALRLGILLQGILMAGGTSILYATFRLGAGRLASSLAALVWVALTYREALSGLEFGLHALLVLSGAFVYRRLVGEPPRLPAHLGLGVLLGLGFLARLDNVVLSALIGAALAWRASGTGLGGDGARRVLAYVLPIAALCALYVVVNLWLCGHALPVSAAVKREWSLYKLSQDPHYRAGGWCLAKAHQLLWPLRNASQRYPFYLSVGAFGAAALCAAGALAPGASRFHAWFVRSLRPWWPFVLFGLLQVLAYVALFHGEFSFISASHQYVVQPWSTALLVALAADALVAGAVGVGTRSSSWSRRIAWPAILAAWCSVPLLTLSSVESWIDREQRSLSVRPDYDSARWAGEHLPAAAVIGSWRTGAMAFLSGRRVVDLSGLVNSWDYFRVDQNDLCDYWDRNGITHLVDLFENGRPPAESKRASYALCLERLERVWSDDRYRRLWRIEAYRIRPGTE